MRDTRVKYKNHSGNTSIHFDSVLVTRADFEHDIIPYFLEWKPRFLFLFSKSTDSILARLLFTVFFLKISVSVVYNSMCQWSKWQKRVRKCYDFKFNQGAEESSNQEAIRKYSVDETAASIYYFLI